MLLISQIISAVVINICWIYIGSIILKRKFNLKNYDAFSSILIGSLLLIVINIYFEGIFKIFMNYLLIGFLYRIVFKEEINKLFVMSIITVALYFASEILFSIPLTIILNIYPMDASSSPLLSLIINFSITLIVIVFIHNKKIIAQVDKLINLSNKVRSQETILLVIFAIAVFGRKNFDFVASGSNYIMNLILILIFSITVYYLYKEKENSISISKRYDQLLNYIQKYELELTQKSMTIHEFKNQIISIKGFIPKRDHAFNDYVDSIMCDLKNLENNILQDMKYIPKGGLKGLIYFKLGDLKEKGIYVVTKVDPKMKNCTFSKCEPSLYRDILKILGIFLDNAIEAASDAEKKKISLEIYCEKKECHFVLSNTYFGNINLNKMDEFGYSTKGKNRGYGLQLARKIISSHNEICYLREVKEEYYIVHLIVKY